ncbi:hypothetical protein GCM10011513_11960 [Franconibacter daqui]|nr:hypothetical protein GCM10011513_11960 [Franconibacter daqui]
MLVVLKPDMASGCGSGMTLLARYSVRSSLHLNGWTAQEDIVMVNVLSFYGQSWVCDTPAKPGIIKYDRA